MRVLAIQLKRIGDLILTLPALRALKANGAQVTLALGEGPAALLPAMGGCVDGAAIYGRDAWSCVMRGGFDACIDFTGRDRSAALTLTSRAGRRVISRDALRGKGRWRRWCYNVIAEISVRERHTADYYLEHLTALGLDTAPLGGPLLDLPAAAALADDLQPGGYVVIHPGSARREKYWRPERWAEVINQCQSDLKVRCVLTGGRGDPQEDRHLAEIRAEIDQPIVDLAGKLDLLAMASVLNDAQFVIGVDSGPMHLAAALGTPQIVLFGPTNPFHWRPRIDRAYVLQSGQDEPVGEAKFRPHSPGGQMEGISTAAVISCIQRLTVPENAPSIHG